MPLTLAWPFLYIWRRAACSTLPPDYFCLLSRLTSGTVIFLTKWLANYKSNTMPVTDLRQRFQPSLPSQAAPIAVAGWA